MAGGGSLGSMGQGGGMIGPPVRQGAGGGTQTPPIWGGSPGGDAGVLGVGGEPGMGGPLPPMQPPVVDDGPGSGFGPPKQYGGVPYGGSGDKKTTGFVGPPTIQPSVGKQGMGEVAPPPPSMPAGLPPQVPGVSASTMNSTSGVLGGAQVNGAPAGKVMSPAADAQSAMMKRAGVSPIQPFGQPAQKKQYPMPAVPPKPGA